jgi:hypothetical protein
MSNAQLSSTTPAYSDRSTRLMLFGVFQISLGCICGLMAAMMLVVSMLGPMANAPQGQAMNMRMMIPGMVLYLLLAVGFIWLGIGSIRARRWAWTLTVVLSWMWLVVGVLSFVAGILFAGPAMSAAMAQQGKMPPGAILVMRIVMGAIMACIYILLPAIFLAFYHRASVRATCQRRDPQIRWTDRCPMPVLALTIFHAWSAATWMPAMAAYGWMMPVFGVFLSGPTGAAVILLLTLVLAYLALGTYRLQMAAWWGTLLLWIVGILNMVAFRQTGLMEMYEKMGMPEAQLEMMRKSGMVEAMARWMPWMGLVGGLVWLGYLLYVRRYFVRRGEPEIGNAGDLGT